MLKFIYTSLIISGAFIASYAQAPFQGTIQFKAENKAISETSTINWLVKEGNSRLDIRSNTPETQSEMSLYFIKGKGDVKMVSTDQGKQMVYDIPYASFANTEFSSAFSAEATGNKGNYAGFNSDEYIIQTANGTVSCWVSNATGIAPSSFPSVILGRGVFSVLQRNNIQGIPVKITTKDFAGNVVLDQEMISVQAGSLGDNLFVVPDAK